MTVSRSALPSRHCARSRPIRQGASSVRRVVGSVHRDDAAVEASTVATQSSSIPTSAAVSSGLHDDEAMAACGCLGGTSRFTCRNTLPAVVQHKIAGTRFRAMKRDCSHSVSAGGGATPPTINRHFASA